MDRQALSNRDDFEYWLASMDEMLDDFMSKLPREYRSQLDFSPASLDVLEAWVLEKYPDTISMLSKNESELVNGLACYIGETFRKATNTHWSIRFDDPKFVFFALPILVDTNEATLDCPITLATATADRRKGTYLRTVLENICGRR